MITYQVLGKITGDNALLVHINSGQCVNHLLFDCGEGCLAKVPPVITQQINQLFFSHLHMDHIGGFDSFFRANYSRTTQNNHIWGPPETSKILHHRFQGFMWNLHKNMTSSWFVTDIYPDKKSTFRYELQEAFSNTHEVETVINQDKIVLDTEFFSVEAITLNHLTPSLGYIIREKPHLNINLQQLSTLGLSPGPWLKKIKDSNCVSDKELEEKTSLTLTELRRKLLIKTSGNSIAYITDFFPDEHTIELLSSFLQGCQTIVCEAKYRNNDLELARKNYHSTAVLTASIALKAKAEELVLFHISERYSHNEYLELLNEARQIFPNSNFPSEWKLA